MLRLKLSTIFGLLIASVVIVSALTSALAVFGSKRTVLIMKETIYKNVASVRAAEELEIAFLREHRAVIAYVFGDGGRAWIVELRSAEEEFDKWFSEARRTGHSDEELKILSSLETVYRDYETERERVIERYKTHGEAGAKAGALQDLWLLFQQGYELGEEYLAANERYIELAERTAEKQVRTLTGVVAVCFFLTVTAGAFLLLLFYRAIFLPLRLVAKRASTLAWGGERGREEEELRSIAEYLNAAMDSISEEFSQKQVQLLESEKKIASVGRLAASVAHEIRNPLNSLNLVLARVVGDIEESEKKRCLEIAKNEIRRLEKIVRNVLEFSRPPITSLKAERVGEIISRTEELLRGEIEGKGVRFSTEEASGVPLVVADAEQIIQVLINLLRNAVEASHEGGQIRISTSVEELKGKKMVVVRVKDSGSGIPGEVQARLFEPFFTTKSQGTGLGLAVAARIMEQHQGALKIESSGPTGTTFALWLRVAE